MERFDKFHEIKRKTDSQVALDELLNSISNRLWDVNGYHSVYQMAIVQYVSGLVKCLNKDNYLTREDLLMLLENFANEENIIEEVKIFVDKVLDEFNYKKTKAKYYIGDTFYIRHTEPLIDGTRVASIQGKYYITKIDDVTYKDSIYYRLRRRNGGDEILVREDILDKSERD